MGKKGQVCFMATPVTFHFLDSRGRDTSRTVVNTSDVLVDVISAATTLAGLWNPLTDMGLTGVTISIKSPTPNFAGAAISNKDENTSVQVVQANGRKYDFDLPDVPDAKHPTELMDITDLDLVAFFNAFAPAGTWRVNVANPQAISQVLRARLDE